MKKILIFSLVSPEVEGRLTRTLRLLSNNEITLISTGTKKSNLVSKHLLLADNRPIGIREQLITLIKLKSTIKMLNKNYDILYCANVTSMPYIKKILKKTHYKKMIYDAYEICFTFNKQKEKYQNKLYNFMDKWLIKKSNLIIEANYERSLLVQGRYKLDKVPMVLSNMNMIFQNKYSKNIGDKIIVGYIGFISEKRNLFKLVKQINNKKNIELHIFGYGSDSLKLEELLKEISSRNIYYYGKYSQTDLPNILKSIDIGFLFYPSNNFNNLFCEPNKILEYASFGVPMVTYSHPKLDKLFKDYNIGLSGENIIENIIRIRNDFNYYREQAYLFFEKSISNRENEELNFIKEVEKFE